MGSFQSTVWKINSKKVSPQYAIPICNILEKESEFGLSDWTTFDFYDAWNRGPFYGSADTVTLLMSNSNLSYSFESSPYSIDANGGTIHTSLSYAFYLQDNLADNFNVSVSNFSFTNFGPPVSLYCNDSNSTDFYHLTTVTLNTGDTYHLRVDPLHVEKPSELYQLFNVIENATITKRLLSKIPAHAKADDACRFLREPQMQDERFVAQKYDIIDNDTNWSAILSCLLFFIVFLVTLPAAAPLPLLALYTVVNYLKDESKGIWDGNTLLDIAFCTPTIQVTPLLECEEEGIISKEYQENGSNYEHICFSSGTSLPFHYHDVLVKTTALTEGLEFTLDNVTWKPWPLNATYSIPGKMKHAVRAIARAQMLSSSKEAIVLGSHFV